MTNTSSENISSIEPWLYRPTFADSWLSDAFMNDTETLTRALQKSISDEAPATNIPAPATTLSGSGSDLDPTAPPRRRTIPVCGGGKAATKRKSRASKRTMTTFITADPTNFRQMVQQVTGVRFGGGGSGVGLAPVLKPEPQRVGSSRMLPCPTLDTSAFLLDNHQPLIWDSNNCLLSHVKGCHQNQLRSDICSATVPTTSVSVAGSGGGGFDFEAFSSFPTLESFM